MGRICSICRHPDRLKIDSALIASEAHRSVAKRFNVSAPAVFRHQSAHLPAQMVKAKEVSEVAEASALVKELRELTRKTAAILTRAMRQKDGDLALKAVGRLERQLELKARLLGQLEERGNRGETRVEVVYIDKAIITPGSPGRAEGCPDSMSRDSLPLISKVTRASHQLTADQSAGQKVSKQGES